MFNKIKETAEALRPIQGGSAAIVPLIVQLLPLAVQGVKEAIDLYNTIIYHPDTPAELKQQYTDVTASLDTTRIAVNENIRRIAGG